MRDRRGSVDDADRRLDRVAGFDARTVKNPGNGRVFDVVGPVTVIVPAVIGQH